jgi:hypothetical protein
MAILTISCQKKEIKIPTSDKTGIQEISNFSEIWIFRDNNVEDSIIIKDNNLIGATNWIFNIDRNVKLKKVFPKIQYFQIKRLKRAEENKSEYKNYLSYSDTINKILSFVDVSNTQFHFDDLQSEKSILKNLDHYNNYNNIHLAFGLNSHFINETKINKVGFFEILKEFLLNTKKENKNLLHLNFNQDLTYQEYLNIKTQLIYSKNELFNVDPNEYIFDSNKFQE